MLILLSYAFQGIGSRNGNLFLNTPDALFLLGGQLKTSVQGVRTAPVDFNKLLLIEDWNKRTSKTRLFTSKTWLS